MLNQFKWPHFDSTMTCTDPTLILNLGPDDDAAIISNVMHYSPRPKFIREAANAFVADTIGTWDIVAMHWRYDKEDFMVHCQKVANKAKMAFKTPLVPGELNLIVKFWKTHPESFFRKSHGVTKTDFWKTRPFFLEVPVRTQTIFLENSSKLKMFNFATFHEGP